MLGWLPIPLHPWRWGPGTPGLPAGMVVATKQEVGGEETTCTGGENNQAEGKGKKNNLSSYNIKALLPSKEIKARVK